MQSESVAIATTQAAPKRDRNGVGLHPIPASSAPVYAVVTMPSAQLQSTEHASTFSQRPTAEARDAGAAAPAPNPPRSAALPIALGALSAILFISTFVYWSRVGSRDETIAQITNHSDQVQASAVLLLAQVDHDKVTMATLQGQTDEAKAASVLDKDALDKSDAIAADTQKNLDKTRIISTDFQTQMEEAKVVSIKHQGEVEIAQAETSVMQIHLNMATAESGQLQAQLTDVQGKLGDAQALIAKLEKSQAKI